MVAVSIGCVTIYFKSKNLMFCWVSIGAFLLIFWFLVTICNFWHAAIHSVCKLVFPAVRLVLVNHGEQLVSV